MEKKIKFLVVEDEAITGFYLKKTLESNNFSVADVAPSSKKAINLFEENQPDIILMDIDLNGRAEGLEAAKEILKNDRKTPIIFMSGYDDVYLTTQIQMMNPLAFLSKPINVNEIVNIANDYFKDRRV